MPFEWSPQQLAVFDAVRDQRYGNVMIEAVAGGAKTSSIVEAANRLPPNLRCVFLAFNRAIAEELVKRLPPYVEAKTFHALCFRAWVKTRGGRRVTVEAKKLHLIGDEMAGRYRTWQEAFKNGEAADSPGADEYVPEKRMDGIVFTDDRPHFDEATMLSPKEMDRVNKAVRLAGLAKNEGVGITVGDEPEVWDSIIDRYDLDVGDTDSDVDLRPGYYQCSNCGGYHAAEDACGYGERLEYENILHLRGGWQFIDEYERMDWLEEHETQLNAARQAVIAVARKLFQASATDRDRIDFDDMLWLCAHDGGRFDRYDVVFVDEAQDLNGLQLYLLGQILGPRGRLVAVGDSRQAIYMFRGAGSDSIPQIIERFGCNSLPLSVTYRCSRKIVERAQTIVPEIQAAPWAGEGQVLFRAELGTIDLDLFKHTDAILCRNVAPLVSLAFKLIIHGTPVRMLGRNIGEGLVTLIRQMKANTTLELQQNLEIYRKRETAKLLLAHRDEMAEALGDKVESILAVLQAMPTSPEPTIRGLIARIQELFSHENDSSRLTLSTVHRSKGLEFDRVFILDSWRMPSKWAKTEEALRQEANLQYVAITRAKSTLAYVNSEDFK